MAGRRAEAREGCSRRSVERKRSTELAAAAHHKTAAVTFRIWISLRSPTLPPRVRGHSDGVAKRARAGSRRAGSEAVPDGATRSEARVQ